MSTVSWLGHLAPFYTRFPSLWSSGVCPPVDAVADKGRRLYFSYAFKFPISGPVLYITICCRLISGLEKSVSRRIPAQLQLFLFSQLLRKWRIANMTTQWYNNRSCQWRRKTARYLQTTRAGTVAECVQENTHSVRIWHFFFFSSRHWTLHLDTNPFGLVAAALPGWIWHSPTQQTTSPTYTKM